MKHWNLTNNHKQSPCTFFNEREAQGLTAQSFLEEPSSNTPSRRQRSQSGFAGKHLRSGETLVETIVAFGVVMVMLSFVTTLIQSAIMLNNRATQRSEYLDADCTLIEQNTGLYSTDASGNVLSDNLTLSCTSDANLTGFSIPVDVRKGELLYYFVSGGNEVTEG